MRIAKLSRLANVALLLLAALEVQADEHLDVAEAADHAVEDMVAETTNETETIPLSLHETVNLAIQNNLGVEVSRHAPLIADEDVSIAWSAYDPTFDGEFTHASNRGAASSSSFDPDGTEIFTNTGSAGINGLIPLLGATLSLDYTGSRVKNNPTSNLSPKYESGLALAATVPLLKGLVWNEPWTQVTVASTQHSASLENFRETLMNTVQTTVARYWQLVADLEQLRVAKKSLQTGQALLQQTRTEYEVGVKSKVEVIQAEAGVAQRELEVIRAEASYRNAQDALIDAAYGIRLTPDASLTVQPTDSPSDYDEYTVDPTAATALAMKNRPELASIEYEIERQETLVRFRKNQRLPQLDLNVTYGTSGVEGNGNEDSVFSGFGPVPEGTGGDFSDTADNWFEKRGGREYSVGGRFTIPVGNYGPRHNVRRARLELRRSKTRLTQLHQRIIVEVRRDIRLLEAARKGIDASERSRVAAEEQLRAERIRLEHGESTPFDVLQKESDLVEAEVSKISALQLYRTSASDLDRAQGTILRTHNIVVGSVSPLRNGMEPEAFGVGDLLEPVLP